MESNRWGAAQQRIRYADSLNPLGTYLFFEKKPLGNTGHKSSQSSRKKNHHLIPRYEKEREWYLFVPQRKEKMNEAKLAQTVECTLVVGCSKSVTWQAEKERERAAEREKRHTRRISVQSREWKTGNYITGIYFHFLN
jgi:hypothetical protein